MSWIPRVEWLPCVVWLALGCAGGVRPLEGTIGDAERARVESLTRSVEAIAAARTNFGRYAAIERRVAELGLADRVRSEWIDWFSLQRNLWIDLPGRSSRRIYVVAHYDKVDVNPFSVASVLLNGLLDPLVSPLTLSAGAVDNATGVAVALELAAGLARRGELEDSYRILLVGAEEMGLRGSRAHVARLSDQDKEAIRFAIVIDSVGLVETPNCVYDDVSDPGYVKLSQEAARKLGADLGTARVPAAASSDFEPFQKTSFGSDFLRGLRFNLIGGLLPQRSWFTGSHRAPVLFFAGCELLSVSDLVTSQLMLPLGSLHGAFDQADQVDARRLHEQLGIVEGVIDAQESELRARRERLDEEPLGEGTTAPHESGRHAAP
jgi:hypothetical protein